MENVYPELEKLKRDIPEPIMQIIEETAREHNVSVDDALYQLADWMSDKQTQEIDPEPLVSLPLTEQHTCKIERMIVWMEAAKENAIKVICRTREDQLQLLDHYIVPDYVPSKLKIILQRTTIKQIKDGLVAFLPPSEDEKSGDEYYPVFFIA